MATSNRATLAFVGTNKPVPLPADFVSDTWTALGEPTDFSDFGDAAETIKYNVIGAGRTRKLKGVRDAGTFEVTFAYDAKDAGQDKLRAAEAGDGLINLKLALSDGTIHYLRGIVESYKNTMKDANSVVMQAFTIALDQAPVTVEPV